MGCYEAVFLASLLLVWESWNRSQAPDVFRFENVGLARSMTIRQLEEARQFHFQQPVIMLWFVVINLFFIFIYSTKLHTLSCFQSNMFQNVLVPALTFMNPFSALLLAYSIYTANTTAFAIGVVMLCNFLCIHVIYYSVSKKRIESVVSHTFFDGVGQLVHRLSSFMFIDHEEVILITSVWRAVCLSESVIQTLNMKKYISADQMRELAWALSLLRNVLVFGVFMRVSLDVNVQKGFAKSALGHIAYMLVQGGKVFRDGGIYVEDKSTWQNQTDLERFWVLLTLENPFASMEVGSILLFSLYLLYLRFHYF